MDAKQSGYGVNPKIAASGYDTGWMIPCQAWLNMKPPSLQTFSRPCQ